MLDTVTKEHNSLARPLRVLVPIIKNELDEGDAEGERAAQPYYERAGSALIEAAISDSRNYGNFWHWAEETFSRKRKFLRSCMELSFENNGAFKNPSSIETLDDLLRAANKKDTSVRQSTKIKEEVGEAVRSVNESEYARPANVTKTETERTLRVKLALQLIDVGYKALAVKLHPDKNKGGSDEAMARLNAVAAMLRKTVR